MEFRQLEFFLACVERGSLTGAAEALYTSQPHVSQVIRSLERELGTELFVRTASGVKLTEAGERIRFYAENVRRDAALIRSVSRAPEGETLRLAVNPSSRLALQAEEFFCARQGASELEYTECGVEAMMDLVGLRRYDLGFLFIPDDRLTAFSQMLRRRGMEYIPLLRTDLVVHCGRKSPFFGRETVAPGELDGCRCIQLEDDYFAPEELLTECESFRRGGYSIRRVIRTNSDHLMLGVLQRTDLCNIGSWWLRSEGDEFSFARIQGMEGRVSFGCLKAGGAPLRAPAEAFLAALRQAMEQQNP